MTVPFNVRWLIVLSAALFCLSCENGQPNKNKDTDQPLTDTQIADDTQNDALSNDDGILDEGSSLETDDLLSDDESIDLSDDDIMINVVSSAQWGSLVGYNAIKENAVSIIFDTEGNRYVAGETDGYLSPEYLGKNAPLFLASYAPDGSLRWVRQWGIDGCSQASTLAFSGEDQIVFLARGTLMCLASFGTDGTIGKTIVLTILDAPTDITEVFSLPSGELIVSGSTSGDWIPNEMATVFGENYGKDDAFIARISSNLEILWAHRWGSKDDDRAGVITGGTDGTSFWVSSRVGALRYLSRFDDQGTLLDMVPLDILTAEIIDIEPAAEHTYYIVTIEQLSFTRIKLFRWEEGTPEMFLLDFWSSGVSDLIILPNGDLALTVSENGHSFFRRYSSEGELLINNDCGELLTVNALALDNNNAIFFAGNIDTGAFRISAEEDLALEDNGYAFFFNQGSPLDAVVGTFSLEGVFSVTDYLVEPGAQDRVADAVLLPDNTLLLWGTTTGDLGGGTPDVNGDTVLIVHSPGQSDRFFRFGTDYYDAAHSVARASDGSIYLTGMTRGSFLEQLPEKSDDRLFILKLSANYQVNWIREFSGIGGGPYDAETDVDGNLFVTGHTEYLFTPWFFGVQMGSMTEPENCCFSARACQSSYPNNCFHYYFPCDEYFLSYFSFQGDLRWTEKRVGLLDGQPHLLRTEDDGKVRFFFEEADHEAPLDDPMFLNPMYMEGGLVSAELSAEGLGSSELFYLEKGEEMLTSLPAFKNGEIAGTVQTGPAARGYNTSALIRRSMDGNVSSKSIPLQKMTGILFDGESTLVAGVDETIPEATVFFCPATGDCVKLYMVDSLNTSTPRLFFRDPNEDLLLIGTTSGVIGERSFGDTDIYLLTLTEK
ncbi:MAG TPA: hypothetical protein PLV42_03590 [bacterium]|nr:hypothetical protein [bacterium]